MVQTAEIKQAQVQGKKRHRKYDRQHGENWGKKINIIVSLNADLQFKNCYKFICCNNVKLLFE